MALELTENAEAKLPRSARVSRPRRNRQPKVSPAF
jgi:hypothetical protein